MRELKEPGLGLARIREGPALVAEQLRFEEGVGNRRAVDVDERAASPRGGPPVRRASARRRPLPVPVSPRRRIGGGRRAVAARFKMCSSCSRSRRSTGAVADDLGQVAHGADYPTIGLSWAVLLSLPIQKLAHPSGAS